MSEMYTVNGAIDEKRYTVKRFSKHRRTAFCDISVQKQPETKKRKNS